MALISKLPGGGGLSKTKPITTYDIKKSASYGDIIDELITSSSGQTWGAIYHEEYDTYIKVYALVIESSKCYIKIFTIDSTGIHEDNSILISGASTNPLYELSSDKESNLVVMSAIQTNSSTIYCINKNTLAVTTISSPSYNGTVLSFYGAAIHKGVIYATISCNLMQPCLYKYNEDGSIIEYIANNSTLISGNCPPKLDAEGNIYMTFAGNGTSYTTILSMTNDGTIRWAKTMAELGLSEALILLDVSDDGFILCKPRTTTTSIMKFDGNGNRIKTLNFFASQSWYTYNVKYIKSKELIQIQDISGKYCYLCDNDFNKLETFELTVDNGAPSVAFANDMIIVVRKSGNLKVETRKPYAEYIKR